MSFVGPEDGDAQTVAAAPTKRRIGMPLFKMTVLTAAAALALAASASADPTLDHPSGKASCAGLFSVAERADLDIGIWPSRDRLNQIIRAYAAGRGLSEGVLYSGFAQDHQGVYAYCDLVSLGVPLP
jgi:hypothetical protein